MSRKNRLARALAAIGVSGLSGLVLAGPASAVSFNAGCTKTGAITRCEEMNLSDDGGVISSSPMVFTVPDGVSAINVQAWGAAGAAGGTLPVGSEPFGALNAVGGAGGVGAKVTGTIQVTPGEQLEVNVGTAGQDSHGGWNGGGNGGGQAQVVSSPSFQIAGGGGGATDIRDAAPDGTFPLANRLLVAGGGGGGGAAGESSGGAGSLAGIAAGGAGGSSGTDNATAAAEIFNVPISVNGTQPVDFTGGEGGMVAPLNSTAAASGGLPGSADADDSALEGEFGDNSGVNADGSPNGVGGDGASYFTMGGGGGGGYVGGGGGGGGSGLGGIAAGGGGGGGGSNFTDPERVTDATFTNGTSPDDGSDGEMIISYGPALALDQTVSTDATGQQLTYTLTATNTGGMAATNVGIGDFIPSGLNVQSVTPSRGSCSLETVATSATSVNCALDTGTDLNAGDTYTVTIVANATEPGSFETQANVSGTDTTGATITPDDSDLTTPVDRPALSVSNDASPETTNGKPTSGQPIDYTLTVTNTGDEPATGVTVTDTVEPGVSDSSDLTATASQGSGCTTADTTTVTCNLQTLAVGSSATVTVKATPTAAGSFNNTANVTGIDVTQDSDTTATVASVVADPADLSIKNTASAEALETGQQLMYQLDASNTGSQPATNAVVTDELPSSVTIDSLSAPAGVSCTQVPATENVTCNLGTLNAGSDATIDIVTTTHAAGTLTATASLQADALHQGGDPLTAANAIATTTVTDPATATGPSTTPVGGANPPVTGGPEAGSATTVTTTTPATTVTTTTPATTASTVVGNSKSIRIWAIKLAGAKVTWNKQGNYPNTKLSFRLAVNANVRFSLMAPTKKAQAAQTAKGNKQKAKGRWKQVAMTTMHAEKGRNNLAVGALWHRHLTPHTTMQIRVQIKSGNSWKVRKTLKLIVR